MNISPVISFKSSYSTPAVNSDKDKKPYTSEYSIPEQKADTFEKQEQSNSVKIASLITALLGILAINSATVSADAQTQALPKQNDSLVKSKEDSFDGDEVMYVEPDEDDDYDFSPREVIVVEPPDIAITADTEKALNGGTVSYIASIDDDAEYTAQALKNNVDITGDGYPYFTTTFEANGIQETKNVTPKTTSKEALEKRAELINELVADYNKIDLEEDDEETVKAKEKTALKAAKEALKKVTHTDLPLAREAREELVTSEETSFDYGDTELTREEAIEKQEEIIQRLKAKEADLQELVDGILSDIA